MKTNNYEKLARVRLCCGFYIIETGNVLFPRYFTSKKEAQEVCDQINKSRK